MEKFDINGFKRLVKDWASKNPEAGIDVFQEFCEDLIPPQDFARYTWLVEQTGHWYQNLVQQRDIAKRFAVAEAEEDGDTF